MSAIDAPVLAALDRLNGHARADGSGRRSIYAHKTLAALVLAQAGELTARPVEVEARCHNCAGTGLWGDWHVHKGQLVAYHVSCQRCARKGTVRLRFIESRHGERVWHHPAAGDGYEILRAAWRIKDTIRGDGDLHVYVLEGGTERPVGVYEGVADWQPHRPGEKLIGDAAAELLNLVEQWAVGVAPSAAGSPWPRERAISEARSYSLEIGRTADRCCQCGAVIDHIYDLAGYPHNLGFLRYRLRWSERCCQVCYAVKPFRWPEKPPPAELVGPHVAAWLERRSIDLTQPWQSGRWTESCR
jgi:hypothetical protein